MATVKDGAGRCRYAFSIITVEPVLFLYMIGSLLNYPTFQAFVFNRVCIDKYNKSLCANLRNRTFQEVHKAEEDYVQSETSYWILKKNIVEMVPSFLIVLFFLGSLGDKIGRKLPIIIPCIGAILASTVYLLIAIFPSSKLEYIYVAAILNGVTGSFTAVLMATFSYITHIATPENRSLRVGILESMTFFAGTVSIFVSGVMLDNTSFIFVFGFIVGTYVLMLLYAFIRLENIKPIPSPQQPSNICNYWFLGSLRQTIQCVAEKREEKKKLYIFWLLVIFIVLVLSTECEINVLLLYTKRAPLLWSQTTFGYYKGLENFTRSLALVTVLRLCRKYFHLRDATIGIWGLVSKAVGLVIIGVATQTWLMFTVVVFAMLQGVPGAVVRSLMSSMVPQDEQGRLFGLVGAVESLTSMIASLTFNELYPASLSFFPGFSFLLAAALCVLVTIVMVWLRLDLPEESLYREMEGSVDIVDTPREEQTSTEDLKL